MARSMFNVAGYCGPLSVEWEDQNEDQNMDREHGARGAAAFVKRADFERSEIVFDALCDR